MFEGDPRDLDVGLAAHEGRLRGQAQQIAKTLERVRGVRAGLPKGQLPTAAEMGLALHETSLAVGFELPWRWGGEWFELGAIRPLTFITGPLGSGKTRLAEQLADQLPDGRFLGLERLTETTTHQRLTETADLAERVELRMRWLMDDGADRSDALLALVLAVESSTPSIFVIAMGEDGLSEPAQRALIAHLRLMVPQNRALFLMTRSSATLDLDAIGMTETVIYCHARDSLPISVLPYPGGRGYEAALTCLAPPDVRARTAGMIASRPDAS